ncbi:MAG: hypothetical protein ABIQ31_24835 [Ferruginibacter sp.]
MFYYSLQQPSVPILDLDKYPNSKSDEQLCPHCHQAIFRISRTWYDRMINLISFGLKRRARFKCRACHKELIKTTLD